MLDQPALEVKILETVLSAYSKVQEADDRRSAARTNNRKRHDPTRVVEG